MQLRSATFADFRGVHRLYRALAGSTSVPDGAIGEAAFRQVLDHAGTQVLLGLAEDQPISMATLHVLPNMTFSARPYALIENVVTLPDWQGQGFGGAVMRDAERRAWARGCYKIMLMTGRAAGARGFYEKLGYSGDEKHAMTLRRAPPRV